MSAWCPTCDWQSFAFRRELKHFISSFCTFLFFHLPCLGTISPVHFQPHGSDLREVKFPCSVVTWSSSLRRGKGCPCFLGERLQHESIPFYTAAYLHRRETSFIPLQAGQVASRAQPTGFYTQLSSDKRELPEATYGYSPWAIAGVEATCPGCWTSPFPGSTLVWCGKTCIGLRRDVLDKVHFWFCHWLNERHWVLHIPRLVLPLKYSLPALAPWL